MLTMVALRLEVASMLDMGASVLAMGASVLTMGEWHITWEAIPR